MVVEILSCFGLAGLTALSAREGEAPCGKGGKPAAPEASLPKGEAFDDQGSLQHRTLPAGEGLTLPNPSLPAGVGRGSAPGSLTEGGSNNVVTLRPVPSQRDHVKEGPHVANFVQERLQGAPGASVAARDLRAAYEGWCAKQGLAPLSVPKLAAELKGLGYVKWKSVGVMRYRDLRFAA